MGLALEAILNRNYYDLKPRTTFIRASRTLVGIIAEATASDPYDLT